MTLIEDLLNWLGPSGEDGREGDYYECRRCGCTLAREDDACTACGSEDVASFVL